MLKRDEAMVGCLLGTAVGDAIGLPYEGLSPRRAERIWGLPDRHRLMGSWGLVSDDTEHACLTVQSLIASRGAPVQFQVELAKRLRRWFLALPAGVGWATARACIKLCLGFSLARSGVYSAGNGPAMRAPALGVAIDDMTQLATLIRIATAITHRDPKAEAGAMIIALAARHASCAESIDPKVFYSTVAARLSPGPETELCLSLIESVVMSVAQGAPTIEFAESFGGKCGVSGYMFHTMPVCLHAWLCFPEDYRAAVTTVIRCGGDADSTAAIVGGLVGCRVGKAGIPETWRRHLVDWPRTVPWMEQLGLAAAHALNTRESQITEHPNRVPRLSAVGSCARNLIFLAIVLLHGFRRLLPPY